MHVTARSYLTAGIAALSAQQSNRKIRRVGAVTAAVGSIATTAAALTVAVSPPESAAVRTAEVKLAAEGWGLVDCPSPGSTSGTGKCAVYPSFSVGPLIGLLTPVLGLAGLNPLPTIATVGTAFNIDGNPGGKFLYDAINNLPYASVRDKPVGNQYLTCDVDQESCRATFVFSTGFGGQGVADAINALQGSTRGETPDGYTPLAPVGATPGGPPTAERTGMTQIAGVYLNNVLRPNGGLGARFSPLLNAIGINTTMPEVGTVGPTNDGPGGLSVFNSILDITWPYNTLADFPITANPLALLNSAMAALPPAELIGAATGGGGVADLLGVLLQSANGTLFGGAQVQSLPSDAAVDSNSYAGAGAVTILGILAGDPFWPFSTYAMPGAYKAALPILSPLNLLSDVVNPLLKAVNSPYLLGTPLADILAPPTKILVNIGYDDVITPGKLSTVDTANVSGRTYAQEGFTAYDRTFYQLTPDKPTPFAWFSNPALTPEETTAAYGDAWGAFTGALTAQAAKPLWGILVPNPDNPPAGASTSAAQAVPTPAPAAAAPEVIAAPVSAPTVSAPEPEPVALSAPVPDSKPVVDNAPVDEPAEEIAPAVVDKAAEEAAPAVAEVPEVEAAPAEVTDDPAPKPAASVGSDDAGDSGSRAGDSRRGASDEN